MPRKSSGKPRKASKPKDVYPPASASDWIQATVRVGEDITSRYSRNNARRQVIARATATWIKVCAHKNASQVAAWPIRMYRAASGANTKTWRGLWPTRRLDKNNPADRKTLAWLRSPACGKASMFAEQADDIEEVLDHPALATLNQPNPWHDCRSFIQSLDYSMELTGQMFLYRPGVDFLACLAPQYTRVVASVTDFIECFAYGREIYNEIMIPREDMIYRGMYPSLEDPYGFEGPLDGLLREADFLMLLRENENGRLLNGNRPGAVIKVPDTMTEDQVRAIEARINAKHQGPSKVGKLHVVQGAELQPLEFAPREMEYAQGYQEAKRAILAGFGIPESEVQLNDANLASSKTGNRQYAERTIRPRHRIVAEALTDAILPFYGINAGEAWFAFDNCVQDDIDAQAVRLRSLSDGALIAQNEARLELGYEAVPEGGKLRMNGVPLDSIGQPATAPGMEDDPEADTEIGAEDDASEPEEGTPAAAEEDKRENEQAKTAPAPEVKAKRDVVFLSKHLCGHIHTKDDKNPPQSEEAKRTMRLAGEMRDKVDPEVRKVIDGLADQVLYNSRPQLAAEAVAALRAVLEAEMVRIAAEGVAVGLDRIGQTLSPDSDIFSVVPTNALDHYATYSIRLAGDVSRTVQDQIHGIITRGLEEGKTMPEVKAEIMAAAPDIAAARAEAIARSETSRALNMGERLAWAKSGIDYRSWSCSGECCPFCEAIAAKYPGPHPINEPYLPLGSSIIGTDGKVYVADYEAIYGPPAHPNCECTSMPEFEGPSTGEQQ